MQQTTKPPRLWPLFGCVIVVLGLFLFQNELPISQALHEQSEVGIMLFSFGLLHMVGGEFVTRLNDYARARRDTPASRPQPGMSVAETSPDRFSLLRMLRFWPFQNKRI